MPELNSAVATLQRVIRRVRPTRTKMPKLLPLMEPVAAIHELEFIAYAEDCLLSGYCRMTDDRLTDFLNDHEDFELFDVLAQDLSGKGLQVPTMTVNRTELLLVQGVGPRGDRARRIRTREHPVGIQIGPYHVRGYLHAQPGSDAISGFRRRRPMVPVTDAWIEYVVSNVRQRHRLETVIVNRQLVDWIVEAKADEVELPDIPLSAYEKGPLLKDFTGTLHVE